MGVNMNFLMNLIQLGLDVGILALCCEAVFRQKSEIKAKDFFIFPILLVLCVVPRVDFSVGANMTASFRSEGFEILPADNIVGLLFLIFAVLLLSSIFFGSKSSGTVFCGTMAAFSIFLFVKCLCAVLFAVCGATDDLLMLGGRIAALCLIVVLEFTPLFGLIHQLVQRSDFTVLIVSANIAVLLMAVLSILSFDVDRILSHLWVIIILILAVLLLDSILLFLHQRRTQEQKRIHMIEQYVPIVEELISQVRARQHEFNNRMMAIEAVVTSADTLEEARKEVTALTGSIGISLNDRELLSCDSKMIAGMLFGKIKQAEVANLHIELAEHSEVGCPQHLIIGALCEKQHCALRLDSPLDRLPQLRERERHIPKVPGSAIGRIGKEHINRVLRQRAQPFNPVHQKQPLRAGWRLRDNLSRGHITCHPGPPFSLPGRFGRHFPSRPPLRPVPSAP